MAVGLAGLVVGAAIGVGVGKSTTKTATSVQTVAGPATTVTHTVTHHIGVRTVLQTQTVTSTASQATPPPSSGGGGGGSNSFSGNGTKSVGTISVPSDSTLRWSCQGCSVFGINSDVNSDGNAINLSSQASSGQSAVSAGTYDHVQVISTGDWSFTIG